MGIFQTNANHYFDAAQNCSKSRQKIILNIKNLKSYKEKFVKYIKYLRTEELECHQKSVFDVTMALGYNFKSFCKK